MVIKREVKKKMMENSAHGNITATQTGHVGMCAHAVYAPKQQGYKEKNTTQTGR